MPKHHPNRSVRLCQIKSLLEALFLASILNVLLLFTFSTSLFAQTSPQTTSPQTNNTIDEVNAAIQQLQADAGSAVSVSRSPATGVASFVRLPAAAELAAVTAAGGSVDTRADAFLAQYGRIFGIQDAESELRRTEIRPDQNNQIGGSHLFYQQVYQGVEVYAGQVRVHFDKSGRLTAANGAFIPDIQLDVTPKLSAEDAAQRAVQGVLGQKALRDVSTDIKAQRTHLYVYRTNLAKGVKGENRLVYEVEVANSAITVRELLYIDAHTGKLVDQVSLIEQINRRIYNKGFGPTFQVWQEGDARPYVGPDAPGVNRLIDFAEQTYNLYATLSNGSYLSFDAKDSTMHSVYNDLAINCPNANWNGTSTNYCAGVEGDDVVAHEWSHAYTQYTHNLIYAWQPGALNEAYSDIFGETVDILNKNGLDTGKIPARTTNACSIYQSSLPTVMTINSPIEISGIYTAAAAAFGPSLSTPITGEVVLAADATGIGTPPSPAATDACEPLTNASQIAGKIALVDRGTCNFTVKVQNAQEAGAIAVIVANHVLGGEAIFNMSGDNPAITIPSVMVGYNTGNLLKANLAKGVNVTLQFDPNQPPPVDSYRWLIGEDSPAFDGAIRDMWNPGCFGDPAQVSDTNYFCQVGDSGGVHSNSGVVNHAFSLLMDGGNFNGQSINGIGLTKAAHIFWRAASVYQTPSTGFPEHADALESACSDLATAGGNLPGLSVESPTPFASSDVISSTDCAELSKVIAAVEYRTPPTQCNFEPLLAKDAPALCLDAGSVVTISHTTWESGLEGWSVGKRDIAKPAVFDSPDWSVVDTLPDQRAGKAAFVLNSPDLGDCRQDDESGVRYLESPAILIPADAKIPHLALDHWLASEIDFDGGNLKISINGKPWRPLPPMVFQFNPYNAALAPAPFNSNPMRSELSFTGSDEGSVNGSWGQSQLSLYGIAKPGDTIRLRIEFGQDGCGGLQGWYVDDVQVYACTAEAEPSPAPAEPFACNSDPVGFNLGIPANWSVVDNAGNGVTWGDVVSSGEGGNYTGGEGNAASVSSDAFGLGEFDTELRSPVFDLPVASQLSLSYLANYQNLEKQDFLDLEITSNGGVTWTRLLSWNEDHGSFRRAGQPIVVNLAPFAGKTGLQLRWRYYDPHNRDYDWYAQIDDVGLICKNKAFYFSTANDGVITNTSTITDTTTGITTSSSLAFADEDILTYDTVTKQWSIFFDGSDVGLAGADVDAFDVVGNFVVLSFDKPITLGGVLFDDSDLLLFEGSSFGAENTAGTFSMWIQGSKFGLTTNNEDIDAVTLLLIGNDLNPVISTLGVFSDSVSGLQADDEDLLLYFDGWEKLIDGLDLGLTKASEDLDAAWIEFGVGNLNASTLGSFAITETAGSTVTLKGKGNDIFTCSPQRAGEDTRCNNRVVWVGDANGLAGNTIDGVSGDLVIPVTLAERLLLAKASGPAVRGSRNRPAIVGDEVEAEDELDGHEEGLNEDAALETQFIYNRYFPMIAR